MNGLRRCSTADLFSLPPPRRLTLYRLFHGVTMGAYGTRRRAATAPWNLHNSGLQKMTAFSVDAQFIPGVLF